MAPRADQMPHLPWLAISARWLDTSWTVSGETPPRPLGDRRTWGSCVCLGPISPRTPLTTVRSRLNEMPSGRRPGSLCSPGTWVSSAFVTKGVTHAQAESPLEAAGQLD